MNWISEFRGKYGRKGKRGGSSKTQTTSPVQKLNVGKTYSFKTYDELKKLSPDNIHVYWITDKGKLLVHGNDLYRFHTAIIAKYVTENQELFSTNEVKKANEAVQEGFWEDVETENIGLDNGFTKIRVRHDNKFITLTLPETLLEGEPTDAQVMNRAKKFFLKLEAKGLFPDSWETVEVDTRYGVIGEITFKDLYQFSNTSPFAEFSLADYSSIRNEYWANIYDLVYSYITSGSNFKKPMANVILNAFQATGKLAWADGDQTGGLKKEAFTWLANRQTEEISNSVTLAQRLSMLDEPDNLDATNEAFKRAEGYAKTLDSIYANIKLMAKPNVMLTFAGDDGEESCTDCKKYKGKRHSAKWWVSRGAVPPSRDFECGGYHCEHHLVDDNGDLYTL